MENSRGLFWVLINLAIIHTVQAQDELGFISLDCGLPANEPSPYKDTYNGMWFSSDKEFIKSGKTGRIQANPAGYAKQYETLRYFPAGKRNCYNLTVEKGRTYLIRATFVYGNYDGLDIKPVFDLYLGPNPWAKIDLETRVNGTRMDVLHIPTSNSLQICLVKNGTTTPLISSLELRPIENGSYNTKSGSLRLKYWYYLSKSVSQLRYPDDVYDRIWIPYFQTGWTEISTALDVSNSNKYVTPKAALKSAATPTNASVPLTIDWSTENLDDQYYLYAHFAEVQDLQANETREFNMVWNGEVMSSDPVTPPKLEVTTIVNLSPRTCDGGECSFQLTRTKRSTLPPLLNAFELYTVIQFPQSETDESDVVAIKDIEARYGLSRINWQGDPCVPQQLMWDGLNCSNTNMSIPPRITTLDLSSSGLNGTIAAAIQNLTRLERLDLSNNNLTGVVPEFLGNMKSLSFINISGNDLNGSIPQTLQRKGLELFGQGNPRLCLSESCNQNSNNDKKSVGLSDSSKKSKVPVVIVVVSVASALLSL